ARGSWCGLIGFDLIGPRLKQFALRLLSNSQRCELTTADVTLDDFAHHRTQFARGQCIKFDAIAIKLVSVRVAGPLGRSGREIELRDLLLGQRDALEMRRRTI